MPHPLPFKNFNLKDKGPISSKFILKKLFDFYAATEFVQLLPYGRNQDRNNFELVIDEACGTCSSKHALLKSLAIEQGFDELQLFIGIYKMNDENTPGIGDVLKRNNLDYIPEAHCYLRFEKNTIDITNSVSDFANISNDVLLEIEIEPQQVVHFKVEKHKQFLNEWLENEKSTFSFDQLWAVREQCIHSLSQL